MSSRFAYANTTIKQYLKCNDETAEIIRQNLASVMAHEPTRAFLAIAFNLSRTTAPKNGKDRDMWINEGKRQAGLFLVACAQSGLDLTNYATTETKPDQKA